MCDLSKPLKPIIVISPSSWHTTDRVRQCEQNYKELWFRKGSSQKLKFSSSLGCQSSFHYSLPVFKCIVGNDPSKKGVKVQDDPFSRDGIIITLLNAYTISWPFNQSLIQQIFEVVKWPQSGWKFRQMECS